MKITTLCPETCIIFITYRRPIISRKSFDSLLSAGSSYRDRVKIIISDATDDIEKIRWVYESDADDVIMTPRSTSAATSRNLATTLALEKYSPKYLCMLEDDFEYSLEWYPTLVEAASRLYGAISPFNLAYGLFSACDQIHLQCYSFTNLPKITIHLHQLIPNLQK